MRTTPLGTFLLRNKNGTIFFDSALCNYKQEHYTVIFWSTINESIAEFLHI